MANELQMNIDAN